MVRPRRRGQAGVAGRQLAPAGGRGRSAVSVIRRFASVVTGVAVVVAVLPDAARGGRAVTAGAARRARHRTRRRGWLARQKSIFQWSRPQYSAQPTHSPAR